VWTWIAGSDAPTDAEIAEAVSTAERADRIIVLTYSRGELPPGQARLVGALNEIGKPLVAVATGTPYDVASYPQVRAALATYALNFVPRVLTSPRVLAAAIDVIFGKEAVGHLPVRLPQFEER
jgi:beta-N-acetylhexosaminidase